MTDLQELFKTVDKLSTEELKQLYNYILDHKMEFKGVESHPKQERVLGLHASLGHAQLSDDFMDELPDEFWLGEA
jgi:hypothetical protein